MDKKGKKNKKTFDYFNNGAQYTMGIEWTDYHLTSTLTEFITCTSNIKYSWKYFFNVITPWLLKGVATSTMKTQFNPFPHGFQTKKLKLWLLFSKNTPILVALLDSSSWVFYGYCGHTNHGYENCLFLLLFQQFVSIP
jgi:hypothetical protein